MKRIPNRRQFLTQVAAGSGLVMLPAAITSTRAQETDSKTTIRWVTQAQPVPAPGRLGSNSLITVLTQAPERDRNPRSPAWLYIREVLLRAGVPFVERDVSALPDLSAPGPMLLLLAGDLRLTADQRQRIAERVKSGDGLIGIAGTAGLEDVFGVNNPRPSAEGWLKITAADHPVAAGLRSSLHVFGGYVVSPTTGRSLAELESGPQAARGSTIVENIFGAGRTLLLAADLLFSIVHLQQGRPVLQDLPAAPDQSALTNDGALKAEDGMVLDWVRDRQPMRPDNVPVFRDPISDELREIIVRSILHVARQQGIAVPLLWYWPRGLKSVAHLSHDTDGHDPNLAVAMQEATNRCGVKSTWCTLFPGGYPRDFYRTLREQGYEIALHYDAMSGAPDTSWSKDNFVMQHRWLLQEAGLDHITSNKNHYTRWEGRLDFLRWCEEVGIQSDQTRGPSKKGSIGFPLGGSQPYFALDDEQDTPRFIPVLEVNMLTQDLVVVCPEEYGTQLMDSAVCHYGVAHFLFHPAHIQKPRVFEALSGIVDYGRSLGLEWWTNEQIYQWEMLRRGLTFASEGDGVTITAAQPAREVMLLLPRGAQGAASARVNGEVVAGTPWQVYGFEFDAVQLEINQRVTLQS